MPEFHSLSERIKKLRKELKENQADFAYHCGISIETLSLIEREKTDVRLSTIQKIGSYSNLTVSELVAVENDDNTEDKKTS